MKILKEGTPQTPPEAKLFRGKCKQCGAVIEANALEISHEWGDDGDYETQGRIKCPTPNCDHDIFVYIFGKQ